MSSTLGGKTETELVKSQSYSPPTHSLSTLTKGYPVKIHYQFTDAELGYSQTIVHKLTPKGRPSSDKLRSVTLLDRRALFQSDQIIKAKGFKTDDEIHDRFATHQERSSEVSGGGRGFRTQCRGTTRQQLEAGNWSEGGKKLAKYTRQVSDLTEDLLPQGTERKLTYGFDGDDLNTDRLYGGQADTAFESRRRQAGGIVPVITLFVHYGANCDRHADSLFWSGAVGTVLAHRLENAGYRVEIYSVQSSIKALVRAEGNTDKKKIEDSIILTKIKSSDQDVRYNNMAALLCNGNTFRNQGFDVLYSEGVPGEFKPHGNLGSAVCLNSETGQDLLGTAQDLLGIDRDHALCIPDAANGSQAEALLKQSLEKFLK